MEHSIHDFETQQRIAALRQLREAIDAVYATHGSTTATTHFITHEAWEARSTANEVERVLANA